jgi:hypothetical protein
MVRPPPLMVHWEFCLANPSVYKILQVAEHTLSSSLLGFSRSPGEEVCRTRISERFLRGGQEQRHSPAPRIYLVVNDSVVEINGEEIYRRACHWPQIPKDSKIVSTQSTQDLIEWNGCSVGNLKDVSDAKSLGSPGSPCKRGDAGSGQSIGECASIYNYRKLRRKR